MHFAPTPFDMQLAGLNKEEKKTALLDFVGN